MDTILDDLLLDIQEGRYKENDKLPSSNTLAEKYKVSRLKIRNVYEKLEAIGYVYSYQGRGYYLKNRNKVINITLGNESFSKKIKKQGLTLENKVIFCERIPYNEDIFLKLDANKADQIYKVGRLRIVDNYPVAIHISYLSNKIFPNIYNEAHNIDSIYKYYSSKGYKDITSDKSLLSVVMPTNLEKKYLNCGELSPLIKLESIEKDIKKKKIIEYSVILYRGDSFKYVIENK